MTGIVILIATSLLGYFMGTLNLALLIARIRGVNLLSTGTQNPGTINAMYSMGMATGIAVLLFDIAKAVIPYFIARALNPTLIWAGPLAGALAVFGHVFPCWRNVKGGKGLASLIGLGLATAPIWVFAAIVALCVFLSFITNGARWVIPFSCVAYAGFTPFIMSDIVSIVVILAAIALVFAKNIDVVKGKSSGSELTFKDVVSSSGKQ